MGPSWWERLLGSPANRQQNQEDAYNQMLQQKAAQDSARIVPGLTVRGKPVDEEQLRFMKTAAFSPSVRTPEGYDEPAPAPVKPGQIYGEGYGPPIDRGNIPGASKQMAEPRKMFQAMPQAQHNIYQPMPRPGVGGSSNALIRALGG